MTNSMFANWDREAAIRALTDDDLEKMIAEALQDAEGSGYVPKATALALADAEAGRAEQARRKAERVAP